MLARRPRGSSRVRKPLGSVTAAFRHRDVAMSRALNGGLRASSRHAGRESAGRTQARRRGCVGSRCSRRSARHREATRPRGPAGRGVSPAAERACQRVGVSAFSSPSVSSVSSASRIALMPRTPRRREIARRRRRTRSEFARAPGVLFGRVELPRRWSCLVRSHGAQAILLSHAVYRQVLLLASTGVPEAFWHASALDDQHNVTVVS